jgi:hypothetical protein
MADITTPHEIRLTRSCSRGATQSQPQATKLSASRTRTRTRTIDCAFSHQYDRSRTRSDSSSSSSTTPATGDHEKDLENQGSPSTLFSDDGGRNMERTTSLQTQMTGLSRQETALSRIRSRKPRAPFSHLLGHVPTAADVIVEFDGKDDPYRYCLLVLE